MNRLILNADDLGIAESTNEAILQAHRDGILTRCSLMVVGPACAHAMAAIRSFRSQIPVGLHISLTSGRPVSPPETIPSLVNGSGVLHRGFASLWALATWGGRSAREEISHEIAAQFQAFAETGLPLNHVDGHRHIHMIPAIFDLVVQQARANHCPEIRISREPFPKLARRGRDVIQQPAQLVDLVRNLPKLWLLAWWSRHARRGAAGLQTLDRVYGILDSGCISIDRLQQLIEEAPAGRSEIIVHPGLARAETSPVLEPGDCEFLHSPRRFSELTALISPEVRDQLHQWNQRMRC